MYNHHIKTLFTSLTFCFALFNLTAQVTDSLPPKVETDSLTTIPVEIDSLVMVVDTTVVDTVVIRKTQEKIRNIPRSVDLMNPVISFQRTNALDEKPNKFKVPSFWTNVNKLGVNFSEVAFVNWNAGGNNSISALGKARFERNYKFRYIQWDNYMEMSYGLNVQENQKLRKTDDSFRVSSTFGFQRDTISNWYYSAKANFNTQFSNGYKYPDRTTPISRFMAPGYSFLGAGTSYITKDQKFNLYISPITQKVTFVLDQDLANKGAFGVEKAVVDADGNIIEEGKNVFLEFGFLVTNQYQAEVMKNTVLKHRLSLYTDYLQKFGNIDVDWELNIDLRVNKYILTSIGTQIIYDDDILFDEQKNDEGLVIDEGHPRIQFKQLLGVGVSYEF
ncbi:DUF3078 domain-containing protein [Pseudozobellia thermophila]|uniref:DUF3078 domain-containing protein n=1 Tax=Pseudozobellia thermophila TaxID=192903 RepID=A0A1M6C5H6_9FLAO|nr:DUF3078 domain-containing protein [Pseudozobellia thermophila]SHI56051.1 Protein of unknown function [Pseudozobellia thermophila]